MRIGEAKRAYKAAYYRAHKEQIDARRADNPHRQATYLTWRDMKTRCLDPADKDYVNYGGRGITPCDRWLSFRNFLADMGERPPGMTIDRVNNALGYSKENCVWADCATQARNRRSTRLNTEAVKVIRWMGHRGYRQPLIASIHGVSQPTVSDVLCGVTWR